MEDLNKLESRVLAWEPSVSEQLCSGLTSFEVTHMLCQVEVMRTGALILVHRMRYPYGVNDEPAQVRATSMLQQLHLVRSAAPKCTPGVFHVLFLAYFELVTEQERQRWLKRLPDLVEFSGQFAASMQNLVVSFWHARDNDCNIFAYNLKDATLGLIGNSSTSELNENWS